MKPEETRLDPGDRVFVLRNNGAKQVGRYLAQVQNVRLDRRGKEIVYVKPLAANTRPKYVPRSSIQIEG